MPPIREKTSREYSRLNVRISPQIKERIQRAAHILGQDLTEFASNTLNQHAREIIENHDQILLSEKDYGFFLDALNRPARAPSKRSMKALEGYKRMLK
ncbi:MAG: DUF1778 domain-containing protein [Pyrinomonadaceae bacterium]